MTQLGTIINKEIQLAKEGNPDKIVTSVFISGIGLGRLYDSMDTSVGDSPYQIAEKVESELPPNIKIELAESGNGEKTCLKFSDGTTHDFIL